MKKSLNHQAIKKENSAACTVSEYRLNHDAFDVATATIAGRYPDERRLVNQACAELAYVMEGSGKIVINHEEHVLNVGDVIIIEAGEKYYWEGQMRLFVSCRPAWRAEQHQIVE